MSETGKAEKITSIDDAISCAKDVLNTEAGALTALAGTIDSNFSKALDLIHSMKTGPEKRGRLIVAGIGKSGHIARKIAATLASTGTPAYFVHPGEASHGDMGMVTSHDIVLMLSNSGENSELSDLIHYARRNDIQLIAFTSNADSTLARHANITILLPPMPEACPNGLAPTTSTTMMIALGDALAVALLQKMGLTAEQFRHFHPGGKLGQKLLTVSDIMYPRDELPIIDANETMDAAIIALTEKNMGAVIVTDEAGELKGIITDGDLKRHMAPDLLRKSVKEIMSPSPRAIKDSALAAEAVNIMTKTPGQYLTSLIVTDQEGKLTGMIRLQDCLQAGVV